MISHKYKCIFIHLARTGGTSIEFALDETVHGWEKHWTQRIMRRKYKNYWKGRKQSKEHIRKRAEAVKAYHIKLKEEK